MKRKGRKDKDKGNPRMIEKPPASRQVADFAITAFIHRLDRWCEGSVMGLE